MPYIVGPMYKCQCCLRKALITEEDWGDEKVPVVFDNGAKKECIFCPECRKRTFDNVEKKEDRYYISDLRKEFEEYVKAQAVS